MPDSSDSKKIENDNPEEDASPEQNRQISQDEDPNEESKRPVQPKVQAIPQVSQHLSVL